MKKTIRVLALLLLAAALLTLPRLSAQAAGAGWAQEDGQWVYLEADGSRRVNAWVSSGGKWYYMDAEGYMLCDAWLSDGGRYYLGSSGAMQSSKWVETDEGWAWLNASGLRQESGWSKIGGSWYYFTDGLMQTGWQEIAGKTYHFKPSGAMQTGWLQDGDAWYYLGSGGAMLAGQWQQLGGKWYYFSEDGAMLADRWLEEGGKRYYFTASGTMQTGWLGLGEDWYYLSGSGVPVTAQWQKISGKWYYFDAEGRMLRSSWVDDGGKRYHVNASGVMQTGWQEIDGSWYYLQNGVMRTGWLRLGGKWYAFDGEGRMLTGEQSLDGKRYLFDENGVLLRELGEEPAVEYRSVEAGTVARFYIPKDLEYTLTVDPYALNPAGQPCGSALLETETGLTLSAGRVGPEAYETAGLPMPASLAEYAQREGVRRILQEGEEFQTDALGNLCLVRQFEQDGQQMLLYYVLKETENAFGTVMLLAPVSLGLDAAAITANSSLLPVSTAAYQTVTAARVGSFHLPAQWSASAPTDLMVDPLPQAATQLSFGDWQFFASRSGPETYWAAGVELPADVDEFSRRSGPQAVLPEGLSYSYDAYGNLGFRCEVQEGGKNYMVYYVLKQGNGCFGAVWMRGPVDSDLNVPYILANSTLDGPGFRMAKAEGVATFCVPEEWEYTLNAAVGDRNPQGVLCEHAELAGPDGIRLETVRFSREDYEEAGLVIPASLEEHSQRPGNQSMLREGEEFAYDDFGNLGIFRDTEDGGKLYYVLKQGNDAFGLVVLTLPAGVELPEAGYLLANFHLD